MPTYSYTTFSPPGSLDTNAFAISSNGALIVGNYVNSSGSISGFLETGGTYITLDDPSASSGTSPNGVNIYGQVVGYYLDPNNLSVDHAFLESGGTWTLLVVPGSFNATTTFAYGINDYGQIVGSYANNTGFHGFLYSGGSYTSFDDPSSVVAGIGHGTIATGINDYGQIVGYYEDSNFHFHGFLKNGNSYTTLDDPLANNAQGFGTFVTGINAHGQIVGYYFDNNNNQHSFLYANGTYSTVDYPSATSTYAGGIDDFGDIVGWYNGPGPLGTAVYGFIATTTPPPPPPAYTYTTIDDPSSSGTTANGINDNEAIVGSYINATGWHGFLDTGGSYTTLDDPSAVAGTWANGINNAGQIVGYYYDASGGRSAFLYSGGTSGTYTTLRSLGNATYALGINDYGQIVGYYTTGRDRLSKKCKSRYVRHNLLRSARPPIRPEKVARCSWFWKRTW